MSVELIFEQRNRDCVHVLQQVFGDLLSVTFETIKLFSGADSKQGYQYVGRSKNVTDDPLLFTDDAQCVRVHFTQILIALK